MTKALIGSSGFIGTTLLKQTIFDECYRSTNIKTIAGKSFDLVICAAAPAQKWIANQHPEADLFNIQKLISNLKQVSCKNFVLISTVDVFKTPSEVNEDSLVEVNGLHAYGMHRRLLEIFVETQFRTCTIIRLPGLVGPGLRKNVVFDLLNGNNLGAIDCRASYQFYPMVNLWYDLERTLDLSLRLVHLTAAPVQVATVASKGFGRPFENVLPGVPAVYDMQTKYAEIFDGSGHYHYRGRESLQAIRAYAQSEPRLAPAGREPLW